MKEKRHDPETETDDEAAYIKVAEGARAHVDEDGGLLEYDGHSHWIVRNANKGEITKTVRF